VADRSTPRLRDPRPTHPAPRPRSLTLALLLGLALGCSPASAHRLKVFAFVEGARIEGSVYFAGGGKASSARIIVTDADGRILAELEPAADGSFSLEAREPVEHRIVAESADGHRAEWRVSASELLAAFPTKGREAQDASAAWTKGGSVMPAARVPPGAEAATPSESDRALDPMITAAIEQAVAHQVRPLREELIDWRDRLRIQDILGGIGYIFGLAGFAFWWHGRAAGRRR
jgi:nickel transport protein